ncbi:MAG: SMC-Scp complex subunit ScpB [Alphaproteobacteria bacterium]
MMASAETDAATGDTDIVANENAANENASPMRAPAVTPDRALLRQVVEALVFASPEPIAEKAIADRLPGGTDTAALLAEIASDYAVRGIRLVKIDACWAFRTAPELAAHLELERKVSRKLSRAALEALGIVAYHQPVTRAEIEEIRGVALSRGTLDVLLEAGWIKPGKRRRTPGRPLTWMTTQEFLDHFSLEKIDDLPGLDELKASGLLDARPRVHVLEPGSSEEELEGEGEESELAPLELDESDIAAEDEEAPPKRPDQTR